MDFLDRVIARFMPPWWLECRIQLDRLHIQGRVVGLTRQEVDEVIDTWNRYYQQTPWPFDWDQAGKAITHRALGLKWEPPTARGNR